MILKEGVKVIVWHASSWHDALTVRRAPREPQDPADYWYVSLRNTKEKLLIIRDLIVVWDWPGEI
jgi:hypothetical protein